MLIQASPTSYVAVSQVNYYGAPTPLKQLAGISVPDSSMLVVQPYDTGAMDEIERGILESDLGINPTNDGKILRLNIPQLTQVRSVLSGLLLVSLSPQQANAILEVSRSAHLLAGCRGSRVPITAKECLTEIQTGVQSYQAPADAPSRAASSAFCH